MFVFFYWLVNVCASDLPYDIYDCVIHDVHFYLLGVHSPRLKMVTAIHPCRKKKNGPDRQVGLRMFLGVSGEVVMWNKAPTPGVDEKAKPS